MQGANVQCLRSLEGRTLELLQVSTTEFATTQDQADQLRLTQQLIRHITTTHADDFGSLVRHAVLGVVQEELRPPSGEVALRSERNEREEEGEDEEEEEEVEDNAGEGEEYREVDTSLNYGSIYPYDSDEMMSMQFSVDTKGDPSILTYLNSQEASQQQEQDQDKDDAKQQKPELESEEQPSEEKEQSAPAGKKKRKSTATASATTSTISTRSAKKKKNPDSEEK